MFDSRIHSLGALLLIWFAIDSFDLFAQFGYSAREQRANKKGTNGHNTLRPVDMSGL